MTKSNLLIADRDVQHLKFLFHFLDATHLYNIMNAKDAKMLLTIIQKHPIHLVILDWNLVQETGLDLLQTLYQELDTSYQKMLLMLNQEQFKEHKPDIEALSLKYLIKPFSKPELLRQIQQVLEPAPLDITTETQELKHRAVPEEYGNPYLQNLANLEIAFRKQIEMLEAEKKKIHRQKEELQAQETNLAKNTQILKAERELLEIEKTKFIEQKEALTQSKQQLQEEQLQIQEEKQIIEKEKRWIILEKKNLKTLQKELNYKKTSSSNEKRRNKKPKVKNPESEASNLNNLNDSNKIAPN